MQALLLVFGTIAFLLVLKKKNDEIEKLRKDRDDAQRLALIANKAFVMAVRIASNPREIKLFLGELLETALIIAQNHEKFKESGIDKTQTLAEIYVWTHLLKLCEENPDS